MLGRLIQFAIRLGAGWWWSHRRHRRPRHLQLRPPPDRRGAGHHQRPGADQHPGQGALAGRGRAAHHLPHRVARWAGIPQRRAGPLALALRPLAGDRRLRGRHRHLLGAAARRRAPREARESLPPGLGEPQMGPIATGLGEIYMWTLDAATGRRASPTATPYDLDRPAHAAGLGRQAAAAHRARRHRGQLHRRLSSVTRSRPTRRSSSATGSRSATCSRRSQRTTPTPAAATSSTRASST